METERHKELIQEEFTKRATRGGSSITDDHLKDIVELAAPKPEDEVLDVATGTGRLALALAPSVHWVLGVDLTESALDQARATAEANEIDNVDFHLGDAEELFFPDDNFDLVTCSLAFHHFPNPDVPLAEIVRVCKKNASILIVDRVASDDRHERELQNHLCKLQDPSHVRLHSRDEFHYLCGHEHVRIVGERRWETVREFEEWMMRGNPTADAEQELRAAFAEALEEDRTGMQIRRAEDGTVQFIQRWVAILLRKLA